MLDKKKIVGLVLFLFTGLLVFTFANPAEDETNDLNDENVEQNENVEQEEEGSLYETAEAAVLNAESAPFQENVDFARELVNELPEGDERDALNERLDAIQVVIDNQVDEEEEDDTTPVVVTPVPTTEEQQAPLQNENVNNETNENGEGGDSVENDTSQAALDEATEAVVAAETDKTLASYDLAKELVDALEDGDDKDELIVRLDVLLELLNEAPVISLVGDEEVTLEAGMEYKEEGATAFDSIDGDLTESIEISGAVNTDYEGTYTLVYSVLDSNFNLSYVIRTVVVVPAIPGPITFFDKDDETQESVGSAREYVEASITEKYSDWVYARSYDDYDDKTYIVGSDLECENGTNCYRITYRYQVGDPTIAVDEVDLSTPGLYFIRYLVNDTTGNSIYRGRWVTVRDTTSPTIEMIEDKEFRFEVGMEMPTWENYITYYDNTNMDLDLDIDYDENMMNVPGNYEVTFTVTETHESANGPRTTDGNRTALSTTAILNIDVVESKPVIHTLGNRADHGRVFEADDNTYDPTTTIIISDAYDEDNYKEVVVDSQCPTGLSSGCYRIRYRPWDGGSNNQPSYVAVNSVDLSKVGKYRVDYVYTDSTGNTTYRYNFIFVEDTTAPILNSVEPNFDLTYTVGDSSPNWEDVVINYTENSDDELELIVDYSQIDMNQGGSYYVYYKVKETKYEKNYNGETRVLLESNVLELTVEIKETPMSITTNVPEFTVGVSDEFTVSTTANGDAGKMVRAHFVLPEGVTVEYQEGGEGEWLPLTDVFGPADGFPLGDITTTLRGTFSEVGTQTVTVEFRTVDGDELLGSKDIEVTVVASSVVLDDDENVVTFDYQINSQGNVNRLQEINITINPILDGISFKYIVVKHNEDTPDDDDFENAKPFESGISISKEQLLEWEKIDASEHYIFVISVNGTETSIIGKSEAIRLHKNH